MTLDDVLNEIATLPSYPKGDELREWLDLHPDFRAEIINFVTDWAEMELMGKNAASEIMDRRRSVLSALAQNPATGCNEENNHE